MTDAPTSARDGPLGQQALSYADLAHLSAGKFGITDAACPLCGPSRHSPVNRSRKVLRVWLDPDFVTWYCARCSSSGAMRGTGEGGARAAGAGHRLDGIELEQRAYKLHQLAKAQWLWDRREPLAGSLAERYLREARGYRGPLPNTLGFLPPSRPEHHPAMIAAFGLADEPEPGVLCITDGRVRGAHLTLLKPDGSGKADVEPNKLMVGPSNGWPIVVAPMNDGLGLAISEGIEDALAVHEATGLGAWAAGAAGRFGALADKVPSYCDCVTIFADDDDAGRKARAAFRAVYAGPTEVIFDAA